MSGRKAIAGNEFANNLTRKGSETTLGGSELGMTITKNPIRGVFNGTSFLLDNLPKIWSSKPNKVTLVWVLVFMK